MPNVVAEVLAQVHGGTWGEHPDYVVPDWEREVSEGSTRLGYWEWVAAQLLHSKP